ncbi:MAG: hypothetical protein KF893_10010, partial [Caldilineaceae bacterium]|nr:hypothetical protein [Caldilineaceae bacterium]
PPPTRPSDADPDERQAHEGAMRARLATLSGRLQARNRFQGSASITWLPPAPDQTTLWRVDAPHMLRARLFGDEEEPDLTLPQLAGKLEGIWLQAIVAEVTRA